MALSWEDHMEIARKEKEYMKQWKTPKPKGPSPMEQAREYNNNSGRLFYIIIMILCVFLEDRYTAWVGVTLIYLILKNSKK